MINSPDVYADVRLQRLGPSGTVPRVCHRVAIT